MSGHTRRYALSWLALMALTGASFLVSLGEPGSADYFVALGIAAVKSTLVVLFFMHLIEQRGANRVVVVVCALFVVLLTSLAALDVASRHTFPAAPR